MGKNTQRGTCLQKWEVNFQKDNRYLLTKTKQNSPNFQTRLFMRKLTKKSLEELGNSLSTISESEQKSYNGGSFVYDQSGVFLGERGIGNDIIIAS